MSNTQESSLKKIVKAALVSSKLPITRILVGFGRSKLNAIFLGAAGIGMLSQANNFSIFLISICSLGLVNGLMQRISFNKANGLSKQNKNVQATVLTTQLILLGIIIFTSLFFIPYLNKAIFNSADTKLNIFIFLIIASTVFSVISANYMEGFFFSYGRYDLYIKASVWATVCSFILFIPCIYFYGIHGGFFTIFINGLFLLLAYLYFLPRIEPLKNVFVLGFDKKTFLSIFHEGLINLLYGALVPLSALFIRNIIIRKVGVEENGVFQICISITALYTPFLTSVLWANMFPEISAKGDSKESNTILYNTLFFVTILSSIFIISLYVMPNVLILILSSKSFLGASIFFPTYFLGDFFYNILFVYGIYLLAIKKAKQYFTMWLSYFILQYLLSSYFISKYGVLGASYGYVMAAALVIIFIFSFFYKKFKNAFFNYFLLVIFTIITIVLQGFLLIKNCHWLIRLSTLVLWGIFVLFLNKPLFLRIKTIIFAKLKK